MAEVVAWDHGTLPDVPIVDAHVHLWDPARFRMPWLDGNDLLCRPYGLDDYRRHTQGLDVASMVYVQVDVTPAYGLLEARWAAERADDDPRLGTIVAYAPLEDGERARSYVEALVAIDPRIRGVRRLIQSEPDPAFPVRADLLRALCFLPEYGLSFDVCVKHHQLAAVVEMVRACPETTFVLDHAGKPDVEHRVLDPWREHVARLAALPNVSCKLSGLVTEADHQRWTLEDLAPYVEHVLAAFGEDRVLFGGDWPVVTEASTYGRWVDALTRLTQHLSADAKRKLWRDNARRIYRTED